MMSLWSPAAPRSLSTVNRSAPSTHVVLWLALLSIPPLRAQTEHYSLASPDRTREIVLRLDGNGRLTYRVTLSGKTVLLDSPLGLVVGRESFGVGLEVIDVGAETSQRERYELFSGIAPRVDRLLNRRSVEFRNPQGAVMIVDLAATDQGVAFRYRFTTTVGDPVEVIEESTGFHVPPDAGGWLQPHHAAGEYTPSYEDFYFHVSPGDPVPHSRARPSGWSFPALFEVPSAGGWILITEVSGPDPYPACHLTTESAVGMYRIEFPRKRARKGEADDDGPARPRHGLPWTMPWRAIVVGADAADIATTSLVTDIAPPARIVDVSWIRPGRASWAWWSHPEGPFTREVFDKFTDFAAEMDWEYTLFDANWWDVGIVSLVRHATKQGVGSMMWTHARDYDTPARRREKLDEVAGCGAIGLKADFWCSDSQEATEAIMALLAEAAERKLMVCLHGCTLPRGWHRTWPNCMTVEAVLGAESYLYESGYTERAAELNTVLPFTRNVAGPMDYTPFALSPKRYQRTTTAAHELANSIICTSGIIHYADSPDEYRKLPPEVLQILRDAPARWEETRCLVGEPGRVAVFARRCGGSWFVAGINGSSGPLELSLDLADFIDYPKRMLIGEAGEARQGLGVSMVEASVRWRHAMPSRGGFVLRLDR